MKPEDCFILKGSTKEEPITICLINEVRDKSFCAYRIGINERMIQGWDYPDVYDNDVDIPSDVIFVPKETYYTIKNQMKTFVMEAHSYIKDHVITDDLVIEPGRHYYGRFINIVNKIEGNRVYYDAFRIEPENISPCWRGDANLDVLIDCWRPIHEQVYQEILSRYKRFLEQLQEYLFNL